MGTRFYQSPGLDIERIARDLEGCYLSQDYQVQHLGSKERIVVQLKMGSELEAVIGMQAALTVTLQRFPHGVVATVSQQKWIDKAAAGVIGMLLLWPLMVTAGVGVIRQAGLESQVFSMLDSVVFQQRSDVKIGSVPPDVQSQAQQEAPQGSGSRGCSNCGALYDAEDVYCSHCGKPLAPPKEYCRECKAEVKSNATFCTKCGTQIPSESLNKMTGNVSSDQDLSDLRVIEPFRSADQWFDDGPFDDTQVVYQSGLSISKFLLRYGDIVDGMQAFYGEQRIPLTPPHGNVELQSTEIVLEPGDRWSEISGFYGSWFGGSYVLQLTFRTLQGHVYGPFGNMNYSSNRVPFSLAILPNEHIIALKGVVSYGDNGKNRHLGALGLVLRPD